MKLGYFCLLVLLPIIEGNENLPSTMCPRFHVEEFVWSVFQPMLKKNLNSVLDLAKISTEAVEELLVNLEEKKGPEGNPDKVKLGEFALQMTDTCCFARKF